MEAIRTNGIGSAGDTNNLSTETDQAQGDSVRVKVGAPQAMRPGALAAVCAITEIENEAQVQAYEASIGSTIYLIEFGDGTSIEIPEAWIEAAGE